jgi:hypothetical protein
VINLYDCALHRTKIQIADCIVISDVELWCVCSVACSRIFAAAAAPEGAISQEVGNYFYFNFLICFCSLGTIIANSNSYFHLGANYTSFNSKIPNQ